MVLEGLVRVAIEFPRPSITSLIDEVESVISNKVQHEANGSQQQELLVFELSRGSECSLCKQELGKGNIVRLEERNSEKLALCRSCAKLDHLWILLAGNAKLTRLAAKYAKERYVILRWSNTRKRYERQGLLIDELAVLQAEKESGIVLEAR